MEFGPAEDLDRVEEARVRPKQVVPDRREADQLDVRRLALALPGRDLVLEAQRQALAEQVTDSQGYLRLADTLEAFLARLQEHAETLDVIERQKILRLVVKEVLVDEDTITIKHAIPITGPSRGSDTGSGPETKSYLLRSGSHAPALR